MNLIPGEIYQLKQGGSISGFDSSFCVVCEAEEIVVYLGVFRDKSENCERHCFYHIDKCKYIGWSQDKYNQSMIDEYFEKIYEKQEENQTTII